MADTIKINTPACGAVWNVVENAVTASPAARG
jgi:hypothetical protein